MKLTLDCPHAEYRDEMRIYCTVAADYCGNQYFKACRGWWALTDRARRCPLRKGREDGKQNAADQDHSDTV